MDEDYGKLRVTAVLRNGRCRYDPISKARLVDALPGAWRFGGPTCAGSWCKREPFAQVGQKTARTGVLLSRERHLHPLSFRFVWPLRSKICAAPESCARQNYPRRAMHRIGLLMIVKGDFRRQQPCRPACPTA